MNLKFLAKSSSGSPYTVSFEFTDGDITASCTCKGAVFYKMCKHLIGLASGDESFLYNPDQRPQLKTLQSWIESTKLPPLLLSYNQAQKAKEQAEKQLNKAKSSIKKILLVNREE